MSWCSRRSAWIALLPALLVPAAARAQGWREAQLWAAAVTSDPLMYGGGIGIAFRDAQRSRVGVAIATGANEDGDAAGRAELTWHFLLDPARRQGLAVYGGGGLALTASEHDRLRPWLQLVLGVEWNPAGARGLFLEAGAGGGARVAAGLRLRKRNAPIRQDRGVAPTVMPAVQDTPASAVAASGRATTGRQ